MNALAAVFRHPMVLTSRTLWMIVPLCVGVAIVYKTIRTQDLKHLPLEILILCGYILVGVGALMFAGWAFTRYAL